MEQNQRNSFTTKTIITLNKFNINADKLCYIIDKPGLAGFGCPEVGEFVVTVLPTQVGQCNITWLVCININIWKCLLHCVLLDGTTVFRAT